MNILRTARILNVGIFSHFCPTVEVLIIRLCLFYFCELFFFEELFFLLFVGIVSSVAGSGVPKSKTQARKEDLRKRLRKQLRKFVLTFFTFCLFICFNLIQYVWITFSCSSLILRRLKLTIL